jgi:menaquinone-dependent protoporphyrinogen oxidase
MNVLVAYASKRGSTAEIAEAITETLRQSGQSVDCIEAGKVSSVESSDAVVLGSAVYIKRWRGDAKRFLRKHDQELSQRPFWVFGSGPVGEPNGEVDSSWLENNRGGRSPWCPGHVVFGGRMPLDPSGPMEHAMVKNSPPEYRDRRDWDEIRAWAAGIASELGAAVPSA